MSRPTIPGPLKIISEYRPGQMKPYRVRIWEEQLGATSSHEQARTQLAYEQLVETHRLRQGAMWILALLGASFVASVVGVLVVLAA